VSTLLLQVVADVAWVCEWPLEEVVGLVEVGKVGVGGVEAEEL
jgi:hypothetical protein